MYLHFLRVPYYERSIIYLEFVKIARLPIRMSSIDIGVFCRLCTVKCPNPENPKLKAAGLDPKPLSPTLPN